MPRPGRRGPSLRRAAWRSPSARGNVALDQFQHLHELGEDQHPPPFGDEFIALSGAETVRAEEIVLSVPDGSSVTTLVNATPIHAEDGAVASVVVTMQDLAPLLELERMRAEFLGMVSHELRTPLAAIKGSTTTALGASRPVAPAETRQFFRIIDEQADRMNGLLAPSMIDSSLSISCRSTASKTSTIWLPVGSPSALNNPRASPWGLPRKPASRLSDFNV